LRADERIVNYVKGLNYLDDRLLPLLTPLDVARPTAIEQQTAWQTLLKDQAQVLPLAARLAGQFYLGLAAIHQVAQATLAETPPDGVAVADRLWQACLGRTRPRLDTLAERIEPKATWDDMALRDDLCAY
jgi:hypothetical protein